MLKSHGVKNLVARLRRVGWLVAGACAIAVAGCVPKCPHCGQNITPVAETENGFAPVTAYIPVYVVPISADAGPSTVRFRFVCSTETMLEMAEAAKVSVDAIRAVDQSECIQVQMEAPVTRVVAGPFTDFQGGEFFVVEIAPDVATLAWPGRNYKTSDVKPGFVPAYMPVPWSAVNGGFGGVKPGSIERDYGYAKPERGDGGSAFGTERGGGPSGCMEGARDMTPPSGYTI